MRIMQSGEHPARSVDPFGLLPCEHDAVIVHITDCESMGDDLVECRLCGYTMRLADLYEGMFPRGGVFPPGAPSAPGPGGSPRADADKPEDGEDGEG